MKNIRISENVPKIGRNGARIVLIVGLMTEIVTSGSDDEGGNELMVKYSKGKVLI